MLAPLVATPERRNDVSRYIAAMDGRQMVAVEEELETLDIPVLVVWGDEDAYFSTDWARCLADTFPCSRLAILGGAKLFFPAERPDELCALLREHWRSPPCSF